MKSTVVDTDLATACGIAVDNVCKIKTNAVLVDAQAQGTVAGRELGVYFIYVEGDEADPGAVGAVNLYAGAGDKASGWGLDAEYSMTPDLHLLASLSQSDSGAAGDQQIIGLGLYWKMAQNISWQPMYEQLSGDQAVDGNGDSIDRFTLTLEADF
jgi:hypothetical protein